MTAVPTIAIVGELIAGPCNGRSRAGRPRATAVVMDETTRLCWMVNAYSAEGRHALAALALGDRIEARGRADHARRIIDAGKIEAIIASPEHPAPADAEGA